MSDVTVIDVQGLAITAVMAAATQITVLQPSPGLQGPAGGITSAEAELIATSESEELRLDIDALVLATLSI